MKVLLLHQHFNTPYKGGAIRSYYLAKALGDCGHHVIVVSGYNGGGYTTENIEDIEVHYLPVAYDNRFGFIKRSLSFIRYAWSVIKLARKFSDANLCYAMSVPLTIGIPAVVIKWRYKIPFIFEVGDLWPEAPVQMGYIKNSLFKKALYWLERWIYKSAEAIVALSAPIADDIRRKVPQKKIHLIQNMSDTDFFKPEMKDPSLITKFKVDGKFVVSYIGAIGVANGLEHFVLCAKASHTARLPIHFLLCGDGAMIDILKEEIKRLQLPNISVIPFQNRDGVKDVLNVTDAAFISYKLVPVLETGSPNKYFDALSAGKLIIINFGGWIREEIARNNCGVYVKVSDPADFVKQITPFLTDEKRLRASQQMARSLAETKYARKILKERFCEIIESKSQ